MLNEYKVIVKTYIVRKYFYFEQMLLFFNFVFIKNQRKKYHMFQKQHEAAQQFQHS